MSKTASILTLGCKVNQYESEAIAEALASHGFSLCAPSEICDVYIINTCTVTAESDRKARQFIRRALSRNPRAFVLVTGCMAQTDAKSIQEIEGVDFICGNRNKMAVVEATLRLCREGQKPAAPITDVPTLEGAGFEEMSIQRFGRTRAYIKIEDGCESRCTYCIIPAARGHIRSKPMEAVLDEVRCLTEGGCREVVLTGIETASWGRDLGDRDLADLLEEVDRIPGIGRVRLGSLDPTIMRQGFVDRIAKLPSLAPHFHLSMQSGSDAVLARMKRKYNRTQALAAIERLRKAIPDVQLTTDIIVGFPGETDADFEATMEFARKARFLMIHVFPYSKRQGTPAAILPDQIPGSIKKQRVAALSALASEIRADILQTKITGGQPVRVLFETYENGVATGHTPDFIEVRVAAPQSLHAKTCEVRLTGVSEDGTACYGERIETKGVQ